MAVASNTQAAVDETSVTGIKGRGGHNPLLKEYQALRRLERRTGRIRPLQRAVKQRFQRVVHKLSVVFAALTPDKRRRLVARSRHHGQDFARLRLDCHHGADFVDHKALGVTLQIDVDAQFQVTPRYGRYVVGTLLVTATDAAAGVADKYLFPFHATQEFVVALLDAEVAAIVTALIIFVTVYVGLRYLADIAEQVAEQS